MCVASQTRHYFPLVLRLTTDRPSLAERVAIWKGAKRPRITDPEEYNFFHARLLVPYRGLKCEMVTLYHEGEPSTNEKDASRRPKCIEDQIAGIIIK
ncbi:hypothetical protein KM043_012205 [Ampulex compressa]|nr:hypothetical protein KM043_012205 [Ampulex compressa]